MAQNSAASPLRVFEHGEYQYRFECPFCGMLAMHLKSYSRVPSPAGDEEVTDINFILMCSVCGRSKIVRNMPISRGLGQT